MTKFLAFLGSLYEIITLFWITENKVPTEACSLVPLSLASTITVEAWKKNSNTSSLKPEFTQ